MFTSFQKSNALAVPLACVFLCLAPILGHAQDENREKSPNAKISKEQVAKLLADLDSPRYVVREKATKALIDAGPGILDDVLQAIENGSLESRLRCMKIVEKMVLSPNALTKKEMEATLVRLARDENNPFSAKAYDLLAALDTKTIADQLARTDPTDTVRRGCFRKIYTEEMEAGNRYTIDMIGNFDTYIRVEDANGRNLAQDDDGGEGLNSRLLFIPPANGKYRIIATSCGSGATGGYTMTIRRERKLFPEKFQTFQGQLTQNDPRDAVRNGCFSKVHTYKMKAGRTYVIDLQSGFDPYLRVEDANGRNLAQDDDGGEGLNSRLTFRANATGEYRLIATSCGSGATGPYVMTVREQ